MWPLDFGIRYSSFKLPFPSRSYGHCGYSIREQLFATLAVLFIIVYLLYVGGFISVRACV